MSNYTLKDIIKIYNGKDYRHLHSGNVPVYGSGGIMCYVDEFLHDGEAILLPRKGTLDNIMYVNGKFWTVDTMYWAKVDTDIAYPKYLYLYLSLLDLSNLDTGSTLPSMTNDAYNMIPVNLPSLSQQIEVADRIFDIDSKISNNNAIAAELESMAKDLYDYWFVQFDFPDENGKPYKSSGGKMVWNEELKREIPDGWEIKHSLDLAQTVTGKEDANFATVNGDYAYFTCGSDVLRCDEYKFEGKAVLIAGNGDFNVKYYDGKFNAYQRTYVLIPEDKYIGLLYRSAINKIAQFSRGSNGSIVKFITKSDVDGIEVLVPTDEMLMEPFNNFLDRIQQLHFENQELASLRDFLLPMLMNGQVKVGGAAGA